VELRQNYDKLQALGFQVIAINPDTPENTASTIERYKLPFTVLGNPPMKAAIDYGIAWRVEGRDEEYYEKLRKASGETHRILLSPSYFILDTDGKIHFQFMNPNFRVRPSFDLMYAAAKMVKQQLDEQDD